MICPNDVVVFGVANSIFSLFQHAPSPRPGWRGAVSRPQAGAALAEHRALAAGPLGRARAERRAPGHRYVTSIDPRVC